MGGKLKWIGHLERRESGVEMAVGARRTNFHCAGDFTGVGVDVAMAGIRRLLLHRKR